MYYLNSDGSPDVSHEEFSECQCLTCMKKRKRNHHHHSWFSWRNIIILILLILGIYFVTTIDFKNVLNTSTSTLTSTPPTVVNNEVSEMTLL